MDNSSYVGKPILDTDFFSGKDADGQAVQLGNVWTNIISAVTGESVNYIEVTRYYDGSVMGDNKVDGTIYRKKESKYFCRALDLIQTRSLILDDIEKLKAISAQNILMLKMGYYQNVHIVGNDYVGVFDMVKSLRAKQPHVTSADGSVFAYKHDGEIIVDVFGVKREDANSIDLNARILESLIEFSLPLKFLRGTYYVQNVDLSKPQYRVSTFLGVHNRDHFPDRSVWSILNTAGASLFVHKANISKSTPIDFRNFHVKSKDFKGEFFECPEPIKDAEGNVIKTMLEAGVNIENSIIEGFNSVLDAKEYATGLRFNRVRIHACRYGIKAEKAANLAKINDVSFSNTAQCISLFGQKVEISNIQLNCKYENDDWENINLFGIETYGGKISNVYTESYSDMSVPLHPSLKKFVLLVRKYGSGSEEESYISNFSFPTAGDTKDCVHMRLVLGTRYLTTNAPTRFYGYAPVTIDYDKKEASLLLRNVLFNGMPLRNDKVAADIDTYIDVKNAPAIVPALVEKYTRLLCERKYNIVDSLMSPLLKGNVEFNKYYDETARWFVVNSDGVFNVKGILNIDMQNTSTEGKVVLAARYRDESYNYQYVRIGVYEMIGGKLDQAFSFSVNHRGNVPVFLCLENTARAGYVPVNATLFEHTKFSVSIRKEA